MLTMLSEPAAEQARQRIAEIFALKVVCVAEISGGDMDTAQVAALTATMIAKQTPAELERYAEMPWEEAIGSIAIRALAVLSRQDGLHPEPAMSAAMSAFPKARHA